MPSSTLCHAARAASRADASRPRRKPRKYRHWAPIDLCSEAWWDQVRKLRVARAEVEAALDAATPADDRAQLDPHELGWSSVPAERAVIRWAAFHHAPSYAFPFDAEIRHTVTGDPDARGVLYRIEGDPTAARAAVGDAITLWPPGLFAA